MLELKIYYDAALRAKRSYRRQNYTHHWANHARPAGANECMYPFRRQHQ